MTGRSAALALAAAALAAAPARAPAADWPGGGAGAASGGIRTLGPPAPAVARRIVSVGPSMTDIVVALGHADRLVGVTRFDTAPEVARLPRIGGFLDPSAEAILALRPDLVLWLTDASALPAVRRIADLGIPVLACPVIGVADVIATTRSVARALGDPAAGERLASEIDAAVRRMRSRAASLPRPRVLFLVGREPLIAAGPGSYPDELLSIAGAANVVGAGGVAWPVFPLERAVAANPDLVIDAAVNERGGSDGAALSAIPAVRRGAICTLPTDDALRPGPRLVRTLETLFEAIHPEAAKR